MTSKYTVQEWMRAETTVYALNAEGTNRFSAQVQGGWATDGRLRTDAEELEANARLIAAAPCLLEACKGFVEEYGLRRGPADDLDPADEQAPVVAAAMRAITKATGE